MEKKIYRKRKVDGFDEFDEPDYREIIKKEFLRRSGLRQSYTINQFAEDLGIERRLLGFILTGERNLSKVNALTVGIRLGLNLAEAKKFRFLVSAQCGRSKYERSLARQWLKFGSGSGANKC